MNFYIFNAVVLSFSLRSDLFWLVVISAVLSMIVLAIIREPKIVASIAGADIVVWLLCEFLVNSSLAGDILPFIGSVTLSAAAAAIVTLCIFLPLGRTKKPQTVTEAAAAVPDIPETAEPDTKD